MLARNYPDFMTSLDGMDAAVRKSGPLDEKTIQLARLAAAAAIGSESAVGCHACHAALAGASPEAVNQTLLALTTVIGFPAVATALRWAHKYLEE
jgi:alkylhydroperoxidase/carboxymuconolactone decarboxylase family protein YurZ